MILSCSKFIGTRSRGAGAVHRGVSPTTAVMRRPSDAGVVSPDEAVQP